MKKFLIALVLAIGIVASLAQQQAFASGVPAPAPRTALQITTPLTVTPANPAIGQSVRARFVIQNNSSAPIVIKQIGAGGRGPNCWDWYCTQIIDFPLDYNITIQPWQSYTYDSERIFWEKGAYFSQLVYQDAGGSWFFAGDRADYSVSDALTVVNPLKLSSTTPEQNRLVFATFTLQNFGNSPLFFRDVGVGTRGPGCKQFDWGCWKISEFPYEKNITLQAGESRQFKMWRSFSEIGGHFAAVAAQDSTGVWHQLGEPVVFTVKAPQPTPRKTSWQQGAHYHPVWNINDEARLQAGKSAGIDIVRIAVPWQMLEPHYKNGWATDWYIPRLTEVIQTANRLGIDVFIVLHGTPCWASSDPGRNCATSSWNSAYPPRDNADYASAMRKMVSLYGNQVVAWEVWNEPNDPRFWAPAPDAQAYTALLKEANAAIKAQQSWALVLGGSMAGADLEFLLDMYDNGAQGHFDALAIHPYSATAAPDACPNLRSSFGCGVEAVRDLMLDLDDPKPIWITEFGWSSYWGAGGVGEANQRNYLQQSYAMINNWDFVPVATWYNLVDTNSASGAYEFEDHMGLFYRDLRPKLAGTLLFYSQPVNLPNKSFMPVLEK